MDNQEPSPRQDKKQYSPTLRDLQLFCELAEALQSGRKRSFRSFARSRKQPGGRQYHFTRLSKVVKKLEAYCGGQKLVVITPHVGAEGLTSAGKTFYEDAKRMLETTEKLRQPAAPTGRLAIGTINALHLHVLPGAVARFQHGRKEKVDMTIREYELKAMLQELIDGNIDIAIGPDAWGVELGDLERKVDSEEIGPPIDMVAVSHPNHPKFVGDRQGRGILQHDLKEERHVVLFGEQTAEPEDIKVPDNQTALVQAQMGNGVAIVPGFYWLLDDLRQRGAIAYRPINDRPQRRIIVYRRRLENLPTEAEQFVTAVKEHLATLPFEAGWQPGMQPHEVPRRVQRTWFAYYVSWSRKGYRAPRWYEGTMKLKQEGEVISGWHEDHPAEGTPGANYTVAGNLKKLKGSSLLVLDGEKALTGDPAEYDRYIAVFNTMEGDCLLGGWIGWSGGQERIPTIGPFLLSPHKLDPPALRRAFREAALRLLPPSAVGLGEAT